MAGQSLGTHSGAVTQTGFDTVLKDYYEGPVREYLNNKVTILKYTDKSSRKWTGRRVVFPLNVGRNSGVGARAESGTLPTAGKQDYVEAHKWNILAASRVTGDRQKPYAQTRDALAEQMVPAHLAEAQRLAREWPAAFEKRQAE